MKQIPGSWGCRTGPSPDAEVGPLRVFSFFVPVLVTGMCHKQSVWTQTAAPAAVAPWLWLSGFADFLNDQTKTNQKSEAVGFRGG